MSSHIVQESRWAVTLGATFLSTLIFDHAPKTSPTEKLIF